jgi:very-short-patch-repair endonuclease
VLTIDLPAQTIAHPGGTLSFAIDAEAKAMLVEGLDAIALTLKRADAIDAFLTQDQAQRPWVYLAQPPHRPDGEGNRQAQPGGGGVRRPLPRLRKTNEGVQRARQLRRDMSPPERRLWALLRARPGGFKFRAQHPADPYILDFYCPAALLCIEVDGKSHDDADRQARDALRDRYLAERGIATIRLSGRDVLHEPDVIIRHIVNQAQERAPLHHDALRHGPPPRSMNREE